MPELYEFRAFGDPQPKGSMKAVSIPGQRYSGVVSANPKLKGWQEIVRYAAEPTVRAYVGPGEILIAGPAVVFCFFTLHKPKCKGTTDWPDTSLDVDKLCRAVFDALTQAKVYEDDRRVVGHSGWKFYPGQGPDALDRPGAIIRVRAAFPPRKALVTKEPHVS